MTPHLRQRAPASLDCLLGHAFRSARVGQAAARPLSALRSARVGQAAARPLSAFRSALRSVGSGPGHCRPARHDRAPGLTGSRRVKVDPEPSLLVTLTFPPCAAVTSLTIATPRPVPPVTLALGGPIGGKPPRVLSRWRSVLPIPSLLPS